MTTKPLKYRCLIIDDEALARSLIQTHCVNYDNIEVVATCQTALEANELLKKTSIDFVFLDIEMPEINGIEWLKQLKDPPKVILTTAYAEFALDGFELNVIDYLLKPITLNRFDIAMNKLFSIFDLEEKAEKVKITNTQGSFLIKSSHELIKVELNEILYIEAQHKYLKIVTSRTTINTLYSLKAFKELLPDKMFYQVHRSFIVQISKVEKINGNLAIIKEYQIPIAKPNKSDFIEALGTIL